MLAGSMCCVCAVNRELRMHVFELRTVTRSKLFSFLSCPHTTKFTLLSIFSPLEVSMQKIRETIVNTFQARKIFSSGCCPRLKNVRT